MSNFVHKATGVVLDARYRPNALMTISGGARGATRSYIPRRRWLAPSSEGIFKKLHLTFVL